VLFFLLSCCMFFSCLGFFFFNFCMYVWCVCVYTHTHTHTHYRHRSRIRPLGLFRFGIYFLKFTNLFRHLVGLLGRGIGPTQGPYLHRTTQHRKTWTYIHASSGIQTHDPSFRSAEDSTCLRPLGQWDQHMCVCVCVCVCARARAEGRNKLGARSIWQPDRYVTGRIVN
jgi:hypothetical protein